ncbi:MAG: methyltransferase, partial [Thermodesulfobacteriota bacterium]
MAEIIYLSENKEVSMADEWFNIAHLNHFWIERRFKVFRELTSNLNFNSKKIGEIGCGMGLVQKQFENFYGALIDGIELNENYLKNSIAGNHPRYCYDIFEKNAELKKKYDHIIL